MNRRAFIACTAVSVLAGPLAALAQQGECRWVEGRYDWLPQLAGELADAKVDLIVAGGTPNALAAQRASQTIPIVVVGATTPVEVGLVKTLARPGGNVTGVTIDVTPEQTAKPSA